MPPIRYFRRLIACLAFGLPIAVIHTLFEVPMRTYQAFRAWRIAKVDRRHVVGEPWFQFRQGFSAWVDIVQNLTQERLVRLWDYEITIGRRPWPWYIATLTDYGCAAGYRDTYRYSRLQLGSHWWVAKGRCRSGISIPYISAHGAWRLFLQWRERRAFRARIMAIDAKYVAARQAAAPEMLATLQRVAQWLKYLPADIRDGSEMPGVVEAVILRATADPRARLATDPAYPDDYTAADHTAYAGAGA